MELLPLRNKWTPNRVSLALLLAIALTGLVWLAVSTYAAPHLIASVYRGESLPIFNRMISGQSSHPLTEYLSDWDSFRLRALLDFSLIGLLVVLVLRPEFQRSLRAQTAATQEHPVAALYRDYCVLALTISIAYYLYFSLGLAPSPLRAGSFFSRYLFDPNDLIVYFNSSAWAVGKGKLYIDVRSEYPVLANLIFGFVRFFSSKVRFLTSDFNNYSLIWIACASVAFVSLLSGAADKKAVPASWVPLLILAPATIYFSLSRYDIYPAVLSLWGLDYLRKRKWNFAALLFGLCIALKGYALIFIPSFFIFCWYQIGFGPAVIAAAIMLSPTLLSNLAVLVWGGEQALLAPYKLQLFRKFNGESTFDSMAYIGSLADFPGATRGAEVLDSGESRSQTDSVRNRVRGMLFQAAPFREFRECRPSERSGVHHVFVVLLAPVRDLAYPFRAIHQ